MRNPAVQARCSDAQCALNQPFTDQAANDGGGPSGADAAIPTNVGSDGSIRNFAGGILHFEGSKQSQPFQMPEEKKQYKTNKY